MPPRPPVPGVVSIVWGGTLSATKNWVNKLYSSYIGTPPTTAQLNLYADNILGVVITQFAPLMAPATVITHCETLDLSSALGAAGESLTTTPGTRAGVEIPGSAAALVSYRIGRHYRGGHPRSYLPVGMSADLLTQSTWTAGFVAAVQAAMLAVLAEFVVPAAGFAPIEHVNVSYYGGAPPVGGHSVPRAVPLVDGILAAAVTTQTEIASQRRRIGRG
jgi:hypothetical protein